MKKCELCTHIARIYCHSDNASLCYTCDQTVHSSNFLVAKHSRTLLCHKCQSPTPWTASGLHLGRAATVCVTCLDENDVVEDNRDLQHNRETEDEAVESSDDEDEDEDDDNEDEDAENQVVPWSSTVSPPVVTGCSSSEDVSSSRVTDRERVDGCIDSEDDSHDTVCSSDRFDNKRSTDQVSRTSFRPLKMIRSDRN